jgi:hypothetical protein
VRTRSIPLWALVMASSMVLGQRLVNFGAFDAGPQCFDGVEVGGVAGQLSMVSQSVCLFRKAFMALLRWGGEVRPGSA